jgi:hypothetical protein
VEFAAELADFLKQDLKHYFGRIAVEEAKVTVRAAKERRERGRGGRREEGGECTRLWTWASLCQLSAACVRCFSPHPSCSL